MNPAPLKIFFITAGEPFHGASPEEKALGGSETALVQAARALAKLGHGVSVFCPCPAPGEYHGVTYRDQGELVRASLEESCDVLVVSRFFPALDLPLRAGLRVLWNHDILDRPAELAQRLDRIDLLLVLSRFHQEDYVNKLPQCKDKLAVTRNGLDLGLLEQAAQGAVRVPGRLVYASRPERGLKLLLEYIWPRLRAALPGLELTICGYQSSAGDALPGHRAEYRAIEKLLGSAQGVRVLGALAKRDYYRHLASCDAMVYPCVFPEISCIAALEAQALDTPVITSDAFALSHTVLTPDFRVGGRPGSADYLERFVRRGLKLLGGREQSLALARQAGSLLRERYGWEAIAGEWQELFLQSLEDKRRLRTSGLAQSLALHGARLEASRLLDRKLRPFPEEPGLPDPDEAGLLRELAALLEPHLALAGEGLAVIAPDGGRTAQSLSRITGQSWRQVEPDQAPSEKFGLVLLRDVLERQEKPGRWAARTLALIRPGGCLALCLASGAWPLISPGQAARLNDLGLEELVQLLGAEPLASRYLARGLVQFGPESFGAGRWLAVFSADACRVQADWQSRAWRRFRPAPPELGREVSHAGLL